MKDDRSTMPRKADGAYGTPSTSELYRRSSYVYLVAYLARVGCIVCALFLVALLPYCPILYSKSSARHPYAFSQGENTSFDLLAFQRPSLSINHYRVPTREEAVSLAH